ncbi:MAG: SURF1 family protein [Terrimesophilobacter sp.]
MNGWRFALSPRWGGYLSLVIVFAIVCASLGAWQLARRAEALAAIATVNNNYGSAPIPLPEALPTLDAFSGDQEWTPVTLHGRYLTEDQLLVRTRPLGGAPGFEVLTPLRLSNGTVFVVDRGWVPVGDTHDDPDSVPAAPSGDIDVVVRLKPGEPTLAGRTAPTGQIATIQLGEIASGIDLPTYTGAYGLLVSENPSPPTRPTPLPKPVLDEGPHLSYAFQWFVFALLGFVAFGWALRQEYRVENASDPAEQQRAQDRRERTAARAPSDAQIEDEILDRR